MNEKFICLVCDEEVEGNGVDNHNGKHKTRHHPAKTSVYGENNYTLVICSRCHPRLEGNITRGEAKILRMFLRVNAKINAIFINSGGIDLTDEEIEKICFDEFLRIKNMSNVEIRDRLKKRNGFVDAIKNMLNKMLRG